MTVSIPVHDHLRKAFLFGAWHGHDAYVHVSALEHDGRKRKRLVADLVAIGYLNEITQGQGDPKYHATAAVMDGCSPVAPDLVAKWDENHAKGWTFWFLRTCHLTKGEWFHAVKGDARFRYYVVHCSPLEHSMSRYADKAGDPLDKQNFNQCPWWGPFPDLKTAQQALSMAHKLPGHDRYEIVIGSAELSAHIDTVKFDELVAEHYPQHFCWGLVKLGILTEAEAFKVEGDPNDANAKRTPRISSVASQGLGMFQSANVGDKPEQWGQTVTHNVTRLIERLARLQEELALMRKVELGVIAYGGWDKFLVEYRSALVEALKKGQED